MNFLKEALLLIQLAMGLLPAIFKLVKDLEAELSIPGFGAEKLGLITATVKEAFALLPDDLEKKLGVDKVEKFVVNLVNYIVALLNKAGIFKKPAVNAAILFFLLTLTVSNISAQQIEQVSAQAIMVSSPGTGHELGGGIKLDGNFNLPKTQQQLSLATLAAWTVEPKAYVGNGSAVRLAGELRYSPNVLAEAFEDFGIRPFLAAGAHFTGNYTSDYSKSTVFPTASVGVAVKSLAVLEWKHYFEEHQTANRVRANDFIFDVYAPLSKETRWLARASFTAGKVKYYQPSGPDKGEHNVWGLILGVGIGYRLGK